MPDAGADRADTVIFCPGAVQADPFVEEIDFTGRHTTSDQELLAMTQLAHSRGMRVFWKPTVNCLDGTWRARISFFDHDVPCETKWSGWFASYQAFQMHFAALAQQAGADLLILGCEMTQAEHRETEWRRRLLGLAFAGPRPGRPIRLYPGACAGCHKIILLCREMKA